MIYGFEDCKFYIDITSCNREIGNYREEFDRRAREIASDKLMLCLSGGLDSQLVLHSLKTQDIPVECSFLRVDGYNETEYKNVKLLEKKYGFKTNVININPNIQREEIEHIAQQTDVHPNHALQQLFVKELPNNYDIVQCMSTPWLLLIEKVHYVYYGWFDPDVSRHRALTAIPNRTGKIIMFGDTSELALSCLTDSLMEQFLNSWEYYEDNGIIMEKYADNKCKKIPQVLRYEYYVKPLFIAKYWKNELIYFPKLTGFEKIDWIENESIVNAYKYYKHRIMIPIRELVDHYGYTDGRIKRHIS
jgi:hypothetical protein